MRSPSEGRYRFSMPEPPGPRQDPLAALERLVASLDRARRRAAAEAPYSPAWAAVIEEVEALERRAIELGASLAKPAAA